MARPSPYPPELRKRADRMVAEVRPDYATEWATMKAVASKLGISSTETLRSRASSSPSTDGISHLHERVRADEPPHLSRSQPPFMPVQPNQTITFGKTTMVMSPGQTVPYSWAPRQ